MIRRGSSSRLRCTYGDGYHIGSALAPHPVSSAGYNAVVPVPIAGWSRHKVPPSRKEVQLAVAPGSPNNTTPPLIVAPSWLLQTFDYWCSQRFPRSSHQYHKSLRCHLHCFTPSWRFASYWFLIIGASRLVALDLPIVFTLCDLLPYEPTPELRFPLWVTDQAHPSMFF